MTVPFPSFMPPAQALLEEDSRQDRRHRKKDLGNMNTGSVAHKILCAQPES